MLRWDMILCLSLGLFPVFLLTMSNASNTGRLLQYVESNRYAASVVHPCVSYLHHMGHNAHLMALVA